MLYDQAGNKGSRTNKNNSKIFYYFINFIMQITTHESLHMILCFYVKMLLSIGIPLGSIMAIYYSLKYSLSKGIILGLLHGLIVGLFLALTIGTIHIIFSIKSRFGNADWNPGVHQRRILKIGLPYDSTFDACSESIKKIRGAKLSGVFAATAKSLQNPERPGKLGEI